MATLAIKVDASAARSSINRFTCNWCTVLRSGFSRTIDHFFSDAQTQAHADGHASLQARRLAALSDQLEQANAQTLQLDISLKHAHEQESSHKWQREALQRKLAVCEADMRSLETRLSAAHMENAGMSSALYEIDCITGVWHNVS